jgi:hypothetical protein
MTLGQYLIRLTIYAALIAAAMTITEAKWGGRGLLGAWVAVAALTVGYFLSAARPTNAVSPVLSIAVAVLAEAVVAAIVWARRGARRVSQRLVTGAAATIVFHLWWFAVAYALIAKH